MRQFVSFGAVVTGNRKRVSSCDSLKLTVHWQSTSVQPGHAYVNPGTQKWSKEWRSLVLAFRRQDQNTVQQCHRLIPGHFLQWHTYNPIIKTTAVCKFQQSLERIMLAKERLMYNLFSLLSLILFAYGIQWWFRNRPINQIHFGQWIKNFFAKLCVHCFVQSVTLSVTWIEFLTRRLFYFTSQISWFTICMWRRQLVMAGSQ